MHVAALVPTRDRPETAIRAVLTFLAAIDQVELVSSVELIIVDDSGDVIQQAVLAALAGDATSSSVSVKVASAPRRGGRNHAWHGGPGGVRNCGLAVLRASPSPADVTIMFDDDVCFANTDYRGVQFTCEGPAFLRSVLNLCHERHAVVGCAYVGRQDLSILEHVRLAPALRSGELAIPPAMVRDDVENVAPGGISTAFLAIGASPRELPDLPKHYNEDYVWLHALARAGWPLKRVSSPLVHAPPGEVVITEGSLAFQVYGEIVWLAVLEHERFPVGSPAAMAAAVAEISGDLISVLNDVGIGREQELRAIIRRELTRCDNIAGQFRDNCPGPVARQLLIDVRSGLAIAPRRTRGRRVDRR